MDVGRKETGGRIFRRRFPVQLSLRDSAGTDSDLDMRRHVGPLGFVEAPRLEPQTLLPCPPSLLRVICNPTDCAHKAGPLSSGQEVGPT